MTILEKIKFEEDWLSEVNLTKENIKIAFAGIRATALEQQPCEDCISREEAINELKLAYFNKDLQSAKDDPCIVDAMTDWAIRTIKRLPSVTPKAEWIPISEKPTEGKYLVTGQYGKIRYVDIATFDGEDAEDTYSWDSYSDEYKIERRKHKVVAYMPLPQPYREESE